MIKPWISRLALLVVIITMLVTGCSKLTTDIPDGTDSASFEIEPNPESQKTVIGSIRHGIANLKIAESETNRTFTYNGGEFKIDYYVNATGEATNFGFLIFVDGMPQPYKIDTTKAPYEYIHTFKVKSGVYTPFTFIFTPVTGKKGNTPEVCIAKVFNPSFIPDMKKTTSYGNYHSMNEIVFPLTFNQNPESLTASSIPQYKYLDNARLSTESVTDGQLKKHKVDTKELDKHVLTELYFDGIDIGYNSNLQLNKNGTLHVKYKILGHPGVRYQNTLYINHQPVRTKEGISFETVLTKGNASVIDIDIDVSKLGYFNTFYIISTPCNAKNFPDDVIPLKKTSSILLYK